MKKTGKIFIGPDKRGQYYVSVVAVNGRILYNARGYNVKRSAVKGLRALQNTLKNPEIIYK